MTLKEIRAMFTPGSKWHALRVCENKASKHNDEIRIVDRLTSKAIIFLVPPNNQSYWTDLPKASHIKEARPGLLRFVYENGIEVVLTAL